MKTYKIYILTVYNFFHKVIYIIWKYSVDSKLLKLFVKNIFTHVLYYIFICYLLMFYPAHCTVLVKTFYTCFSLYIHWLFISVFNACIRFILFCCWFDFKLYKYVDGCAIVKMWFQSYTIHKYLFDYKLFNILDIYIFLLYLHWLFISVFNVSFFFFFVENINK